jgi:hypothetical protein
MILSNTRHLSPNNKLSYRKDVNPQQHHCENLISQTVCYLVQWQF